MTSPIRGKASTASTSPSTVDKDKRKAIERGSDRNVFLASWFLPSMYGDFLQHQSMAFTAPTPAPEFRE